MTEVEEGEGEGRGGRAGIREKEREGMMDGWKQVNWRGGLSGDG